MGRLLVHKVTYSGDNYSFESPSLNDGLSIIEGPNGTGKSTFMNFIYYGLSGKVEEFSKSNRQTHFEIINDTNNYVLLDISINSEQFQLKRFINSNDITILGTSGEVQVFPVNRSKNEKVVFSDWVLEKLSISVVEVFQGVHNFRINIKDLFRLIYHNQELNPRKIYKPADADNIIADSDVVRKIIFELLLGKTYSEYYETLAKYKEEERKRNIAKALHEEYVLISQSLNQNKDDLNLVYLNTAKAEKEDQLNKLYLYRDSLKSDRPKSTKGLQEIKLIKSSIQENEIKMIDLKKRLNQLLDELIKLERLKENIILEVTQIKKIIHSHDKLNLFSADTCPYCLREVDRKEGHCVCGQEIDENQYERFFYNSDEYLDILKSKQKSVETVESAISSCLAEEMNVKVEMNTIDLKNEKAKVRISDLLEGLDNNVDISRLNEVDDQILKVREDLNIITQTIESETKRYDLNQRLNSATIIVDELRNKLKVLEAQSAEDISLKISEFNKVYNELMITTLSNCRSARIGADDYFPIIDEGTYREASSFVSTRLMYYLTLLSLSLTNDSVKFPRLLLIDTPETGGVDQQNLLKSVSQISTITKDSNKGYQIILTTGLDKYPEKYKPNVVLSLSDTKKLLQAKSKKMS